MSTHGDEPADLLVRSLRSPRPVEAHLGGRVVRGRGDGEALVVRTDAFEVLRLRLGRRSIEQVEALEWSESPEPVLGAMFVFGPRAEPLVE